MMWRDKIVCGRRVSCQPVTFGDGKRYTGRIIYAHPGGRWITVEFETAGILHAGGCGTVMNMIKKMAMKWADEILKKELEKLEEENRKLQNKLDEYTLFVEKALERLEEAKKEKEKREWEEKRREIEEMEKKMREEKASWEEEKDAGGRE